MNIFSIAKAGLSYWEKHGDDLAKLIPKGSDPTFRSDATAFVKKHFPQYNPNNLIDDTLALIDVVTAPDVPFEPPQNNSSIGG